MIMDRLTYILKIMHNIEKELKSLLVDSLKEKDPDTYYKLVSVINKYFSRNSHEDDIDHS